MAEWRLEGLDDIRDDRPWMNLARQPGFSQRAEMLVDIISFMMTLDPRLKTISDLGCGDGSLLAQLAVLPGSRVWGYELGRGDVDYALFHYCVDVRQADILTSVLEYGDISVVSEVLEHLAEPSSFLQRLALECGDWLVASSPSRETDEWHNSIHSWAWDLEGYRDLLTRNGWDVVYQTECDGGWNTFNRVMGKQKFQAVVARKS